MQANFLVMHKIITFYFLITFSISATAQQTNKQPTLKESVKEVKASAKALGDLFKKKKIKNDSTLTDVPVFVNSPSVTTSKPEVVSTQDSTLDKTIVNLILAHVISENKRNNPKLTKNETTDYAEYQFNFGEGITTSYYFSKLKKDNVWGDLNVDGQADLIVKLSSNSGGNTEYLDLLIFLKDTTGWKLALIKAASDEKLKGCEIGSFVPLRIERGLVYCEAYCFTNEDPRCCPSLKYKTTLKWENNNLFFVKMEKL